MKDFFLELFAAFGALKSPVGTITPTDVIPFTAFGMALILFTIKENASLIDEMKKISKEDLFYYKEKHRYYRLIIFLDKTSVLYLISLVLLLIAITFPNPLPDPIPAGYVFIINLAYLTTFLPILLFCIYYFIYKLMPLKYKPTESHVGIGTPIAERPSQVSSPKELPPQALPEPDVNLSTHPAPIVQSF